jgi:hypothetical protein
MFEVASVFEVEEGNAGGNLRLREFEHVIVFTWCRFGDSGRYRFAIRERWLCL